MRLTSTTLMEPPTTLQRRVVARDVRLASTRGAGGAKRMHMRHQPATTLSSSRTSVPHGRLDSVAAWLGK